jgi:hypothetical protein
MMERNILFEGVFSNAKRVFGYIWTVDELLVSFPDEYGDTVIVDIDVAEIATGFRKVAEVKGECVMVGGFKVVHILFEDITGYDGAGVF